MSMNAVRKEKIKLFFLKNLLTNQEAYGNLSKLSGEQQKAQRRTQALMKEFSKYRKSSKIRKEFITSYKVLLQK